jgi:hypothetical protein
MAIWNLNGEVVYSDGPLSVSSSDYPHAYVIRHFYKVPYSNTGKGGFIFQDGKKFHVPSWTEVHSGTTIDDIQVEKKPFQELFVEPKTWSFKSESSDKEYTVKESKNGNLSCNCWGYMAHKKCKHVKQVQEELI